MKISEIINTYKDIEYSTLGEETKLGGYRQPSASYLASINTGGSIKLLPSSKDTGWTEETPENWEFIHEGTIITLGKVRNANTKYYEGKFISSQNIIVTVRNPRKLLPKFVFYFIDSVAENFYPPSSALRVFSAANFKMTKIPVPPMTTQVEVVKILDEYTENQKSLTENLAKEIKLRKTQLDYYKDSIFENLNAPSCKIGEFATDIIRGMEVRKKDIEEKGTPCIHYGEIFTKYNLAFAKCESHINEKKLRYVKNATKGDILFALTGESYDTISKSVAYLGDEKIIVGSDIAILKHKQNPKYIAYALETSDAKRQKQITDAVSTVPHVKIKDIENIKIPLPDLKEQEKVVNTLDALTSNSSEIINNLSDQLHRYNLMYNHYRNVLLGENHD